MREVSSIAFQRNFCLEKIISGRQRPGIQDVVLVFRTRSSNREQQASSGRTRRRQRQWGRSGLARRGDCAGPPGRHGPPCGGGVTVLVHWIGTGHLAATPTRPTSPTSINRPHDRYERAPTRGRPSAGPWGNRWQTRRLNSLKRARQAASTTPARPPPFVGGADPRAP